jgi:hypothetical protein
MTQIRDYPVAAQVQPGQLTGQLPASAPEGPQSIRRQRAGRPAV